MKKLFFVALASCALVFSSCKKEEATTIIPDMVVTATLNGANEVPANTTTAVGAVAGTYNRTSKILKISTTYTGFSASAGHIHPGAAGTTGSALFTFGTTVSPIAYTSSALTAEQEANLLAGKYYVNLHSTAFPGGQIRGQLMAK